MSWKYQVNDRRKRVDLELDAEEDLRIIETVMEEPRPNPWWAMGRRGGKSISPMLIQSFEKERRAILTRQKICESFILGPESKKGL